MKESVWSKDGMKMLINSGWKEFDRQTNLIDTGNVYTNTQFSSFIRPYKETECNGLTRPEGYLLDYDLKPFKKFRIPWIIMEILNDKKREDSVILYMFFIQKKDRHMEPFSWVVTDRKHKLIESVIVRSWKQNYRKRFNAAKEVISYIT